VSVDGVENIGREREESVFYLVRRGDPVARPDDDRRRVEIIEGELRDLGRHRLQETAPLAGVGGEQDFAGLLHALDDLRVVERNEGASVNDLRAQPVLRFQYLRGIQRTVEGRADGQDGQVAASFLMSGSPIVTS
jgi:hypothetical protein